MPHLVLASLSSLFFGLFGVSWDSVDRKIEREFPAVDMLTVGDLSAQLSAGQAPLIIDVRRPEEFAVSHIPDAVNLETADAIAAQLRDKEREVVVYCSVGYRSAAVAAQLQQLGFSRVRNLRHSIFAWANDSRPLVNDSGSTEVVHPFNRAWGQLVKPELRQYPD